MFRMVSSTVRNVMTIGSDEKYVMNAGGEGPVQAKK
jgi:hypothetical protein